MKKIVSIILACMLISGCIPSFALATNYVDSGKYEVKDKNGEIVTKMWYDIAEDGTAEINEVMTDADEIVFPAEIDGHHVKSVCRIDTYDKYDIQNLKSISFEDGIEYIDKCYFHSSNLERLKLPNTLKGGKFSFQWCTALKSITIPGSLEETPYAIFDGCKNLSDVTIEDGVKVIGKSAFAACNSLKSIVIPDSVFNIDDDAFQSCENLKDVTLSENLEYIGDNAFMHSGIENIKLPSGLTDIGEQAFAFTPLKSIKLPDSLKSIGYVAFKGCRSLTKAYIPRGIMNKPNKMFYVCNALTDVTFDGEITKELYDHLTACTPWGKKYEQNVTDDFVILDGYYLSKYKGKDKNPVIPDNITAMSERAFENSDIDTVTLSLNIKEIPTHCFAGSKIKEIVIPSNVKQIKKFAFLKCYNLEKITFEEGVEKIEEDAFMDCYSLVKEKVSIPKSVKVASKAFRQTPLDKDFTYTVQWNTDDSTPTATSAPDASPAPTGTPKPTDAPQTLTVQNGDALTIEVNGKTVNFPDAQPFVDENGRTQVPVRAVSELLDCKVDWLQDIKTAVITKSNGDIVKITLYSDIMTVNDRQIKMDTSAVLKDDRTFIPVRFTAEALGLTVNWSE